MLQYLQEELLTHVMPMSGHLVFLPQSNTLFEPCNYVDMTCFVSHVDAQSGAGKALAGIVKVVANDYIIHKCGYELHHSTMIIRLSLTSRKQGADTDELARVTQETLHFTSMRRDLQSIVGTDLTALKSMIKEMQFGSKVSIHIDPTLHPMGKFNEVRHDAASLLQPQPISMDIAELRLVCLGEDLPDVFLASLMQVLAGRDFTPISMRVDDKALCPVSVLFMAPGLNDTTLLQAFLDDIQERFVATSLNGSILLTSPSEVFPALKRIIDPQGNEVL